MDKFIIDPFFVLFSSLPALMTWGSGHHWWTSSLELDGRDELMPQ